MDNVIRSHSQLTRFNVPYVDRSVSMLVHRAWAALSVCEEVDGALRTPVCFRHLVRLPGPVLARQLDTFCSIL